MDEAEDNRLSPNANRLYLPQTLPEGVFFIVTSREEHDYRLDVAQREDIYIRDNDPKNIKDIRQYVEEYLQKNEIKMLSQIEQWQTTKDEFIELIVGKSDGNFMYLVYVLNDIKEGRLNLTNLNDIRNLPKGLRSYYQRHWRCMQEQDRERFKMYYEPVVCKLAVAQESIAIDMLAKWTKLSFLEIKRVIQDWRQFLNEFQSETESKYQIYHASFKDFLRDEVGLERHHRDVSDSFFEEIDEYL